MAHNIHTHICLSVRTSQFEKLLELEKPYRLMFIVYLMQIKLILNYL